MKIPPPGGSISGKGFERPLDEGPKERGARAAGALPASDSYEKAQSTAFAAALRSGGVEARSLGSMLTAAVAAALGGPAGSERLARLANERPGVTALPGFAAAVERGAQALAGDASQRQPFLGGLSQLARASTVDTDALLFHAFRDSLAVVSEGRALSASRLGDEIAALEARQEEARNHRQLAKSGFENFDQKANQAYDLLSAVVKAMAETRSIGAGSRSGL